MTVLVIDYIICVLVNGGQSGLSEQDQKTKLGKPTPFVLAVNICDSIIRDETTKKVSLIGLFSVIRATNFPAVHPLLHIYAALTNGHGKYKTGFRFVRIGKDEEKILPELNGELNFANPLQVVEINFSLRNLTLNQPGTYEIQIICDGSIVGQRKFYVMPMKRMLNTDGTEVK